MIDIHSHFLYGLDDGAETFEDSVAMLEMAATDGTTDIVASPHSNLQFEFKPELVAERLAALQAAVGDRIRLHCGCDFHFSFDNIQYALEDPAKYTINHKGYLLVEFSDLLIPNNTGEILDRMIAAGMAPIITHPERNPILQRQRSRLEEWLKSGVTMQITAMSLQGRFGNRAEHMSFDMLQKGQVHFIASDAHDTKHRPPTLRETFDQISAEFSPELAAALLVENPSAVIDGRPLPQPTPAVERKARKWYQFWA